MFGKRWETVETLLRSPLVSLGLVAIAGWFISSRWVAADWSSLRSVDLGWLLVAAVSYVFVPLAIAVAAGAGFRSRLLRSALAAQIHKYVPGGIWQAQPLVAAGGLSFAGRMALATFVTAGFSIGIGTEGWVRLAALAAAGAAVVVYGWRLGAPSALLLSVAGGVAAGCMVGSGAAISSALDLESLQVGRAVGAAWGFGVIAVPVPSGLGVREASLTILLAGDGAVVATTHRLVTLVSDVVMGAVGIGLLTRQRSIATDPASPE